MKTIPEKPIAGERYAIQIEELDGSLWDVWGRPEYSGKFVFDNIRIARSVTEKDARLLVYGKRIKEVFEMAKVICKDSLQGAYYEPEAKYTAEQIELILDDLSGVKPCSK